MNRFSLFLVCLVIGISPGVFAGNKEQAVRTMLAEFEKTKDAGRRAFLAYGLGLNGKQAAIAIPALRKALSDSDDEVKGAAQDALNRIVEKIDDVRILADTLHDGGMPASLRQAALKAILQFDPQLNQVPDVLVHALKGKDIDLVVTVLNALGQPGSNARHHMDALFTAVDHPSAKVRVAVVEAAMRIDPDRLVERALRGKDVDLALAVLKSIARSGAQPEQRLKELLRAMDHSNIQVRIEAIVTLMEVDQKFIETAVTVEKAVKSLQQGLKDKNQTIRLAAVTASGYLLKEGKPLLPQVSALMEDPDAKVRDAASHAANLIEKGAIASADFRDLMPAETELVVHLHVKTLLDLFFIKNQFHEEIRRELKQIAALESFHIDPVSDVAALTLAVPRFRPGATWMDNEAVLILQGRFDKAKPLKFVEADGIFAVCLNPRIILVSNQKERLMAAVKNAAAKPRKLPRELQMVLSKVDRKASFWLAWSLSPDSLKEFNAPKGLTGITLTAEFAKAGVLQATFQAADVEAAKKWHELLTEAVKYVEGTNNEIRARVSHDENAVHVRLEIRATLLEELARSFFRRQR